MNNNKSNKRLLLIKILILSLGILSFYFGSTPLNIRTKFANSEWPLGSIENMEINSKGNLYIASATYKRIQVYDKNGEFLFGWFIPTWKGFKMKINEDNNLCILFALKNNMYTFIEYTEKGGIIMQTDDFAYNLKQQGKWIEDSSSSIVFDRQSIIGTSIYKRNTDGKQKLFIVPPLYWIPINFPIPGAIFLVLGNFLLIFHFFKPIQIHRIAKKWSL